ncbi:lysozyme [Azospirillum sp. TSH100]|uniref:lysozyme n=1 Tax=Azospirillum sp. TSH100 TaxID=652764 RepID=UPI000D656E2D|nr:lysozyme [Azospirillum sp. TSH100]QCG92328.1 lysozyme [Azospirillum sp. TSH100]
MRTLPQAAVDLAKQAEGLRLTAYPDPASGGDPWTIGYGHTGPDVHRDLTITADRAEQLLLADLDTAAAVVDRAVTVDLTDNQRAALTLFVMNVGAGRKAKGKDAGKDGFVTLKSGQPSTMLRKLNLGDAAGAAAEFAKWTRGAGKVMPGLVKRRAAEAALFLADEVHPVSRGAEPAPAPAPVTRSAAGVSGLGALGLTGVAAALDQARDVSTAARGLLESLPAGGLGWAVAVLLAGAVVILLLRQRADQRRAAA